MWRPMRIQHRRSLFGEQQCAARYHGQCNQCSAASGNICFPMHGRSGFASGELFSVDNLDPENFKQDFYTAGGILLNTAERVCCPDIAYLCSYDSKPTARQMLSRLQDC